MPAPAAFTRSVIAPKRSASATARRAVSAREASPATWTKAAPAGTRRETPTTFVPRSTRRSARARPSPVEAPVTIATMPPVYDSPMPLVVNLALPLQLLVLIGGGEFSFGETREIDEYLLRHLPPDRRTVAFLPTASGSAEYARHLGAYFASIDPSVETVNVPVYRGRDNRRQKNLNAILAA